jgi:hypothetical protein
MAINTSAIRLLLTDDLSVVFDTIKDRPPEWTQIFEQKKSKKSYERDVEVKLFGPAQLRSEGAAVAFEDAGERFETTYRWLQLALGFIITRNAIRDNLYKDSFGPNAQALKRSIQQAQEVYAASVLNNAADSTGVYYGGDNQPLLSASHPIDSGTFSNTPTVQAELSEVALQDAITAINYYKDTAGLYSFVDPKRGIITPDLQFVWNRLFQSQLRVGTADNDTNALKNLALIDSVPLKWRFIINKKAWFIQTDAAEGLKSFERDPIETSVWSDDHTDNLLTKATWRGGWGWSNSRAIYGSTPA